MARLGEAIDARDAAAHEVMAVPYGTDASTLAEAGIPAVVFGPGDIAQAHTCDEWVPLDEVEQAGGDPVSTGDGFVKHSFSRNSARRSPKSERCALQIGVALQVAGNNLEGS